MKKLFIALMLVILIGSLILGGCVNPAPVPATPSAPAPVQVPAPSSAIEIKFATSFPEAFTQVQCFVWWGKEIERRTGGKVKFTFYYAGALGGANELSSNVEKGLADMCMIALGWMPGRFPVFDMLHLVTFRVETIQQLGNICEAFYKTGLLDKDFAAFKLHWWFPCFPMYLFVNKKVETLENLRGLRVRTALPGKIAQVLGMDAANMPPGETEMALQRGIIDGVNTSYSMIGQFKLGKYTPYCLREELGITSWVGLMNTNKWNSLPSDIQAIINEVSPLAYYRYVNLMTKEEIDYGQSLQAGSGMQVYRANANELQRMRAAAAGVMDAYAAELEAKGLPGKKIKDEVNRIVDLYTLY